MSHVRSHVFRKIAHAIAAYAKIARATCDFATLAAHHDCDVLLLFTKSSPELSANSIPSFLRYERQFISSHKGTAEGNAKEGQISTFSYLWVT